MHKNNSETINYLAYNRDKIYYFETDKEFVGILLIDRGERLFFQYNEKTLICGSLPKLPLIDLASVKQWSNGNKISNSEKKELKDLIVKIYKKSYLDDPKVII